MLKVLLLIATCSHLVNAACSITYPTDTRNISGVLRDVYPCSDTTPSSNALYAQCGQKLNAGQPTPVCVSNSASWICGYDFERWGGNGETGIVDYYLNTTYRIPNLGKVTDEVADKVMFTYWYRDNPNFNIPFPMNLVVSNAPTCNSLLYQYVSGDTTSAGSNQFFPVDGRGFGSQYNLGGTWRNFAFTFSSSLRFTYQGNEQFNFNGDDDLWVFINDRLAMDLGGLHPALAGSFNLNWPANGCAGYTIPNPPVPCSTKDGPPSNVPCACLLGLKGPGNSYTFDLFYNERHTTQSTLSFTTSLYLQCPYFDHCGICQGDGQSCCSCTSPDSCHTAKCDVRTPTCIYTPKPCPTSTNLCLLPSCNVTNGACGFSNVDCDDQNMCTTDSCDPAVGCLHPEIPCDDADPCTIDTCDPASGCVHTRIPNCQQCSGTQCPAANDCLRYECTIINSTQSCSPVNTTCSDGNACTADTCELGIGCTFPNISCDDRDPCTEDSCDSVRGCQHTRITCDDGNACTNDVCVANIGSQTYNCSNTAKSLPASNKCLAFFCDPLYGVLNQTTTCPSACAAGCDPVNGCNTCPGAGFTVVEKVATGIGAGVIAGIVIAIVAALIIASIASKKGYDVYIKHKNSIQGANTNPLYNDEGRAGTNPLFEQ